MGCTLNIACAKGGTLNFKQQKNLSFFRKKKTNKKLSDEMLWLLFENKRQTDGKF